MNAEIVALRVKLYNVERDLEDSKADYVKLAHLVCDLWHSSAAAYIPPWLQKRVRDVSHAQLAEAQRFPHGAAAVTGCDMKINDEGRSNAAYWHERAMKAEARLAETLRSSIRGDIEAAYNGLDYLTSIHVATAADPNGGRQLAIDAAEIKGRLLQHMKRIDAAGDQLVAGQPERCCLDYPRCDCNSPPEPDTLPSVCEHGIRHPWECRECADAAWEKHKRATPGDEMKDIVEQLDAKAQPVLHGAVKFYWIQGPLTNYGTTEKGFNGEVRVVSEADFNIAVRLLQKVMARCADLLDEDQFNELDAMTRAADPTDGAA